MNFIFVLFASATSVFIISCTTPGPKPKTVENTVFEKPAIKDTKSLEVIVESIVHAGKPNRSVGKRGHKKSISYLKKEFQSIAAAKQGGKFFVHEFHPDIDFAVKNYQSDFDNLVAKKFKPTHSNYQKWDKFTKQAIRFVRSYKDIKGQNLVLELPGEDTTLDTLYIGAHYDTITHNHQNMQFTPTLTAPGADDNASGVAAIIEIARALSAIKHKRTVRIIAFDYEEIFFLGSYAFAKDLNQNKISQIPARESTLGLINYEMIGWSSKPIASRPIVKIYANQTESKDLKKDMRLAEAFMNAKSNAWITPEVLANGFNRSDNWSFWQNSLPAITISEDWEKDFNEKNYHTAQDLPHTLNYPYLKEIVDWSIPSIINILNN